MKRKNSILKHLDIFVTKYIMNLKENKEYRTNLYSALLFDFVTMFMFYLFLSVFIGQLAGDILIGWRNYDYILYYMLLIHSGKGVRFFFLHTFCRKLLDGTMNIYLSKPVNPYFFTAIQTYRGANALTYPLLLLSLIVFIFAFDYTNYLLGFGVIFFGTFYYMAFFNFFSSISFFVKDNSLITETISWDVHFFIEDYTPKMFEKMKFFELVYLFPCAIFGYLGLSVFQGNLVEFNLYMPMILITFFGLLLGNYLLWHYGLKKYEAFG